MLTSRVAFTFAKAIFIAVGMLITWHRLKLPDGLSSALLIGFILTMCGLIVFLMLQLRGFARVTARFGRDIGLPEKWIAEIEGASSSVDARCSELLPNRPRRPGASDRRASIRICVRRAAGVAAARMAEPAE